MFRSGDTLLELKPIEHERGVDDPSGEFGLVLREAHRLPNLTWTKRLVSMPGRRLESHPHRGVRWQLHWLRLHATRQPGHFARLG